MKRLVFCLFSGLLSAILAMPAHAGDTWQRELFWGIDYLVRTKTGYKLHVLKVDLWRGGVRPFVTPGPARNKTVPTFLSTYKMQVAINTSFYNMNTGIAHGYFESNGAPYSSKDGRADLTGYTPSGFTSNNDFLFGLDKKGPLYNAYSGMPVIIAAGKLTNATSNACSPTTKRPRTAVGIDKTGRYFYMMVVEGDKSGLPGMNCHQLAQELFGFGVEWGINLDGGGSSVMAIQGRGAVNNPNELRKVASSLGFFAYANKAACKPSTEICDSRDNDCDAQVDEGDICAYDFFARFGVQQYSRTHSDIDGDGKVDYCARAAAGLYCHLSTKGALSNTANLIALSNASGWNNEKNYHTIQFADINGDGKADVCARANAGVICWSWNGTKFVQSITSAIFSDEAGWSQLMRYATIRFADINGDGKDDLCGRWPTGYGCHLSSGTAFAGVATMTGALADAQGWTHPIYYTSIQPADINGDGKVDICARAGTGILCWPSKGNSFGSAVTGPAWSDASGWNKLQYGSTIQFGDINGDGKDDICGRAIAGVLCHLSTGTGFGPSFLAAPWSDASGWNDPSNYQTIRLADINGDGKKDLCGRANTGIICVLSEGTKFGAQVAGPALVDTVKWGEPNHYHSISYGDYNGDHMADICARAQEGVVCYPSKGKSFGSVENGAAWTDANGWSNPAHAYTFRFSGLKTCTPDCNNKKCGPDGCGGSCGTCSSNEGCKAGVCTANCVGSCTGKSCGDDGCGKSCGSCKTHERCSSSGQCVCTPQCLGKVCGDDACGGSCGTCESKFTCTAGQCLPGECVPQCETKSCGDDTCGGQCGVCEGTATCTEGVCVACVPDCEGKACGSDGCGASCGQCAETEQCDSGVCNQKCVPTPEICDGLDNDCDGEFDEDLQCEDCVNGVDLTGQCDVSPSVKFVEDSCSCQSFNVERKTHAPWLYLIVLSTLVFVLRRTKQSLHR